uniref:Cytochrome c oxidase subunit 7B, mitochondrial n=1 Tax=Lates calcarifer TaxID=8187 RepID=A0A4W6DLJ3_LATCA
MNRWRQIKLQLRMIFTAVRQVRHGSTGAEFHAKYGNGLLVSGGVFCTAVWAYVLTQTGLTWNLSPVGKVMPKEWREAEEE